MTIEEDGWTTEYPVLSAGYWTCATCGASNPEAYVTCGCGALQPDGASGG